MERLDVICTKSHKERIFGNIFDVNVTCLLKKNFEIKKNRLFLRVKRFNWIVRQNMTI